ncbi:MAG: hypothetical protein JSV86_14855 [Gemmatimonadota bacterium]|nr:MAG: hypothetical protein JSV86_14855 [Gemmatimonadota bacterium]
MKRIIPFLLLAFVAAACQDEGPTVPVDDLQFAVDCEKLPDHPKCGGDGDGTVIESIEGDYWMTVYLLPAGPYQDRWAWFDAKKYDDGTVVGEWRVERFSISTGHRVSKSSGNISCFTIIENQAWIGGTQKRVPGDSNHVLWRVIDGDPVGADDQSTMVCHHMPYPGGYYGCFELADYDDEMYCAETPPYPDYALHPPIDSGTVVLTVY